MSTVARALTVTHFGRSVGRSVVLAFPSLLPLFSSLGQVRWDRRRTEGLRCERVCDDGAEQLWLAKSRRAAARAGGHHHSQK